MTKYIKISNYAPCVNRLSLEKLGYSSKRDDPDSIGQFGSGIKYAPISALRLGLEFVFTGHDDKGAYTLKYKTEVKDGINCIVYDYGDYVENSSFTLEAGIMSWDNEFQIYREAVSNAKDGEFWKKSIVDEITIEKDTFAVYITASPLMMDIYNNHDSYFCENTPKVFSHEGSSVLEKTSDDFRIFCKTVLVHKDSSINSMFDYEMNLALLNEDRNIKSLYSNEYDIISLYCKLKDKGAQKKIIKKAMSDDTYYEFKNITDGKWDIYSFDKSWSEAFYSIYPKNSVILSPMLQAIDGINFVVKEHGFNPVNVNTLSLYKLLSKAGVNTAVDKLGEKIEHDLDQDIEKYPNLIAAIKIAKQFEPGLNKLKCPIVVFTSKNKNYILGQVINLNDEENAQILIEKTHAEQGNIYNIVSTIIHEYDHLSSKLSDGDYREFRALADNRIGQLMCKFYDEPIGTCDKGVMKFKAEDIVNLKTLNYKIEYSKILGAHIAKFGEIVYLLHVQNKIIERSGVLTISENGEELYADIGIEFSMKNLNLKRKEQHVI